MLLTIGFIAASVAYSSWISERTIFDPAATRGATNALLATPTVHNLLAREVRSALESGLPPTVDKTKLNRAINAAVDDPKFIGAFEDAIVNINEAVLANGHGRITLDSSAVTRSVNQAVARFDPQIAAQVKKTKAVSVPIGSTSLPRLGDAERTVREVGLVALLVALACIGGGLALAPTRKTFRRAGRRVAFLAIAPVLVFEVGPRLLAASHNSALTVSAAILHAYAHRVLFSAAVLVIAGASTWLIAIAMPKRRRAEETPEAPALRPVYVRQTPPRAPVGEPAGVPEKLYL